MKDDEERPNPKNEGKDEDDDAKMRTNKPMEEDVELEEEMHGDMKDDEPMADDMEMDLDVEDEEEEEMDMDAGDMGELTLTDEEAEVFLKVADKVRAAMEMGARGNACT